MSLTDEQIPSTYQQLFIFYFGVTATLLYCGYCKLHAAHFTLYILDSIL